jgi:MFS family permease
MMSLRIGSEVAMRNNEIPLSLFSLSFSLFIFFLGEKMPQSQPGLAEFPPARRRTSMESVSDPSGGEDETAALIDGGGSGGSGGSGDGGAVATAAAELLWLKIGVSVLNFLNAVLWFSLIVVQAEYDALQSDFQLGPRHLALISALRQGVMYGVSPAYGYLADTQKRSRVFYISVLVWALATFLMAGAQTYAGFLVAVMFAGASMAAVVPLTYSFLSDFYPADSLGTAFGWLGFSSVLGGLAGVVVPVILHPIDVGVAHWRVVLYCNAGAVAFGAGVAFCLLRDPKRKATEPISMRHMRHLAHNATFWVRARFFFFFFFFFFFLGAGGCFLW